MDQSFLRSRHSGFTLLELLVVIAIIGILGAMAAQQLIPNISKAEITRTKSDIATIASGLDSYRLDNGKYPSIDEGLQALVAAPATAKNWQQGGYLTAKKVPLDAWGNEFQYLFPGENGAFDIYSLGSDSAPGGEGDAADIGNW